MPVLVSIQLDTEALQRAVGVAIPQAANLRPLHADIGAGIVNRTRQRFHDQKDPEGKSWEPNSPATILSSLRKRGKARRAAGPSAYAAAKKILREHGELADSIAYRATDEGVNIGSNLIYARVHQYGIGERSSLKSRRRMPAIPARPFLGVTREDEAEILEAAKRHYAKIL